MLQLRIEKVVKEEEVEETMGKRLWRRVPIAPFCMDKPAKPTGRWLHLFSLDLCSSWHQLPGMNSAGSSRKGSVMLT